MNDVILITYDKILLQFWYIPNLYIIFGNFSIRHYLLDFKFLDVIVCALPVYAYLIY